MLLQIANISKYYKKPGNNGQLTALKQINLAMAKERSLGLVGESGAGKSTLARMILCIEYPSEGKIYFNGKDLFALTPKERWKMKKEIQMIWQDPFVYLNPFFTVFKLIAEPLEIFGIGNRRQQKSRVAELLEMVNLTPDILGQKPHELSGGQCQRVAIARALALNPRLLICDEPLSALDIPNQAKILHLFEKLRQEKGITYFFIAHDLSVVRRLCQEIAVIKEGKIVEKNRRENIFSKPAHSYTQRLLESTLKRG